MKTFSKVGIAVLALSISGAASALKTEVATGQTATLFVQNGSLYCSGSLSAATCGDGGEYTTTDQKAALDNSYISTAPPDNEFGHVRSFFVPTYMGIDNVTTVDAIEGKTAFLAQDGSVFWMGFHPTLSQKKNFDPVEVPDLQGATDITLVGGYFDQRDHLAAVIDGRVFIYSFEYDTTVEVTGLPNNVVAIDGDATHLLMLTADGMLYASGDNMYGALGNGSYTTGILSSATQVVDESGDPLLGVSKFSAGENLSMAIVAGVPYTWGLNRNGALGLGTLDETITREYAAPISNFVTTGLSATDVSTDGSSLILAADGSLWAMGWHNGIMGGAYLASTSPTMIVEDGVEELYVSNGDVWFVKHKGEIKGWGGHIYGQQGHGESVETHELTLVAPFRGGPENTCPVPEPQIVTEYVEVPGPIQYVTEYVEVPVEVEVIKEVQVPGPTEYVVKEVPRDLSAMTKKELKALIREARRAIKQGNRSSNRGHGNNTDRQDDDNPGKGKGGPNAKSKDGHDDDEHKSKR